MSKTSKLIAKLRKQQDVVKGMEWFRLEEEINELLEENE